MGIRLGQLSFCVITKNELKEKFNKIEKVVKDEVKVRDKKKIKQTVDEVKNYFEANKDATYFVKAIDIPTNAKAVTEAINYLKSSTKDKSIYLLTGNDPKGKIAHGCYISNQAMEKDVDGAALAKQLSSIIGGKSNVFQCMSDKQMETEKAVAEITVVFKEELAI